MALRVYTTTPAFSLLPLFFYFIFFFPSWYFWETSVECWRWRCREDVWTCFCVRTLTRIEWRNDLKRTGMSSLWESWANKGGRFMKEAFVSNPALVGGVGTLCPSQRPQLHPSFSHQHPTQAKLLEPFPPWCEYHTGEQGIWLPEQPQEGWCSSLNLQKITSPAPNLKQQEEKVRENWGPVSHCCLWLLWGPPCTPRKKLFSIRWMSLALIFEARLSCVIQTKLKLQTLFPQPLMGL